MIDSQENEIETNVESLNKLILDVFVEKRVDDEIIFSTLSLMLTKICAATMTRIQFKEFLSIFESSYKDLRKIVTVKNP